MAHLCSSLLLSLVIASAASAVTMDWTPIGNPGNACDPQPNTTYSPGGCFGAVGYDYQIGTYEVTNAQYAEFLNAKAKSDPLFLYDGRMGNPNADINGYGGITRSGSSGNFIYAPIAGRESMPVNHVTFYDAMRFANWMNNGQGNGDTEAGAYTLLGNSFYPHNGFTVSRNASATIVLPTEDEWYKAAYYDAISTSYFDYPAGSNTQTICSAPSATANRANCFSSVGDFTSRGSYPGSLSPYGTYDQGGNIAEWSETRNESFYFSVFFRGVRGGNFMSAPAEVGGSARNFLSPDSFAHTIGFRLAMIPEPGTGLLAIAGLVGLAGWRRARN